MATSLFATLDAPHAVDLTAAISGETVRLFASYGIGPGPCNPSGAGALRQQPALFRDGRA